MDCDVCLEPDLDGGVLVPGSLLPINMASVCLDCFAFATVAGIRLSDAADFLELTRNVNSETLIIDGEPAQVQVDCPSTAPWSGEATLQSFKQTFESVHPEPVPQPAGTVIPAPTEPDPSEPPDPEANLIRVFQWPAHCGQWFVRIGSYGDRRSIQYGPLRSGAEVLEGLARHLAARGYRFDGGYEPPAA